MSTFETAIGVILKHEGGWGDDPEDAGGETNFGISTLIIQREKITPEMLGLVGPPSPGWLKAMTVTAAERVYRQLFWERYRFAGFVSQDVATKVFDCAVNCGPFNAIRMAQRVANALATTPARLDEDGSLGPKTFAAVNSCETSAFMVGMRAQMEAHYLASILKRPANLKFKSNWMRRAAWGTLP